MWVTGTGPERFSTLVTLAHDLKDDLVEALRVALGASREDMSTTA